MTGRPTFINHADEPPACRGHNPEWWFPTRQDAANTRKAKAICHTCPHENACREWAYAQPPTTLYGIWGGTTEGERRRRKHRERMARRLADRE
ncbi:WhiB family transcriptional regulator [Micromonospora sp. S4605]|uniref:WhiB family transcriptional regulator n=1 Tax=Micromonospora sp. S4605 TaxID=1420897 RepID=UPI000D6FA4F0|nr:WhiB family transcriptional regulator [Micromonospora sp. S4605]PWU52815.1 WhiB family transcriptional regulator [Micromonospora sp. S4605]